MKKSNLNKRIELNSINIPTYEEIIGEIHSKVGTRPSLPNDLGLGDWSEQALKVLSERYLLKDKNGKVVETPEQMCWRVSWEIASSEARWGATRQDVEQLARKYYLLMIKCEFLPNSPTLMNAGAGNYLQYSACFVLPVEDSLVGIFDALKYQALIHQTGGGTGFSFSRLRPKGSIVKSSGGVASGPVSFMRIFDAATNEIKQGGKRRGANMGILRIDHPDILEFIDCKNDGEITNFNISVGITDKFMNAYEAGEKYDLTDPKTKQKVGELSAREVFEKIQNSAWKTGDPGVIFLDRRNRGSSNPVPSLGPIEATNPCGEQELYPFDACNLGSIFLGRFVKPNKQVDWDKLRDTVKLAVGFLDSVIEVNPYPLEQIRRTVFGIRRIGLGVGGWADMLIDLEIAYDSEEALVLGEKIMRTIQKQAIKTTQELARKRGPFPMWSESIYKDEKPRRNATVTTIAPTGSISIIANSSSGIEPLFAIAYQHKVKDKSLDRTLTFINPKFREVAENRGFWSKELEMEVLKKGVVRDIGLIPDDVKRVFGTAHEIHHNWHIKMQAVFQKWTDNAVSKTINMQHDVTPDDIGESYLLAWRRDCKGVTVFRDGCKDQQVLNLGVKEEKKEGAVLVDDSKPIGIRPFRVVGATYKLHTPVGSAFITINENEFGEPLEVFINAGKAGSEVTAMAQALGRVVSTSLRFKSNLSPTARAREIADQLSGIAGRRSVGFGPNKVLSLSDAVAIALSDHFGFGVNGKKDEKHTNGEVKKSEGNGESKHNSDKKVEFESGVLFSQEMNQLVNNEGVEYKLQAPEVAGDICPSCGASSLVYQEGCMKCYSCAYSEC